MSIYYYLGDTRVAMRKGTGLHYMQQDHLSGTSMVSDSAGAQVGTTMKYYPFGGIRSGSVPTDLQFTGQRLDGTGLYYYRSTSGIFTLAANSFNSAPLTITALWSGRYYDPTIGRFIQPDTIVPDSSNPQAFNRYSYVKNNPLKYTDPDGHWGGFDTRFSLTKGLAMGGGLGAIGFVSAYALTTQPQDQTLQGYVGSAFGGFVAGTTFTAAVAYLPATPALANAAATLCASAASTYAGLMANWSVQNAATSGKTPLPTFEQILTETKSSLFGTSLSKSVSRFVPETVANLIDNIGAVVMSWLQDLGLNNPEDPRAVPNHSPTQALPISHTNFMSNPYANNNYTGSQPGYDGSGWSGYDFSSYDANVGSGRGDDGTGWGGY